MRTSHFVRPNRLAMVVLITALAAAPASAHVILDDPNGGEALAVGSTFTIEWHIAISHNLLNWDLWYSTTGSTGPWTEIAMNLPPGSNAVGSVHTYDWTIPDAIDDTVWVRVKMDNSATDYYDVSNGPFSIVPPPPPCPADLNGDDDVGPTDLAILLVDWGCADCPADLNGDGVVDPTDLAELLVSWGPCEV